MSNMQQSGHASVTDRQIQECPYSFYQFLHQEQPVYFDQKAGFYIVSRYEDVREILTDPARFSSAGTIEIAREGVDKGRAERARRLYAEKGWVPALTLSMQDDPRHKEVRALFTRALRAGKIKEMDASVQQTAIDLVEAFRPDGKCEVVNALCVPLPLIAICNQVGVPIDDIWMIKKWTDAWIRRFNLSQSEEEEIESINAEIDYQHYFTGIVDNLKRNPNGSILSDLVNTPMANGVPLSYAEIVSHLMVDFFAAGSETTTNAMSEGILLLCQHPDQYALLMSDLDRYLPRFVEETLRLRSPVQGLFRVTTEDTEVAGVTIPARSLLQLRFGAANFDAQQFECPMDLDLERSNGGSHLAFGSGIHHCVGAPLARRELIWGFDALLRRCANIRMAPNHKELTHMPSLMLLALQELHIEFDPVEPS